ncbi:AT-rich interactive domain-containing protein 3 isoform X2 [Nymphaea colorata]|uniref:AT-rich interactive domain-containing protein 3 isoform X2 n=1 Tax=Nymphaea colorata TaxID=210225 RepID=UPI00129D84F2|nr:AT-rich interactive domain-containing protein 3 isoform X2 [Nymphaea colorata]
MTGENGGQTVEGSGGGGEAPAEGPLDDVPMSVDGPVSSKKASDGPVGEGGESSRQGAGEGGDLGDVKAEGDDGGGGGVGRENGGGGQSEENAPLKHEVAEEGPPTAEGTNRLRPGDARVEEGDESGSEEEQAAFVKELENFFKERNMEFKVPKFYGEGLNCLKLWRAVTRLGGYDHVTTCKLWRQVGESFKPPKTCTTISWSFRIFYEKALLDYERHKTRGNELVTTATSVLEPSVPASETQSAGNQAPGSGRARRDAAARAMQGWHSQRLLGNGEVGDPIIKDRSSISLAKRVLKRKKLSIDRVAKTMRPKAPKSQVGTMVVDIGQSADWVKVNVRKTKDCFEVYALVPGLLREEVRVQSDPAGRLIISGEPEQIDNPWGVTPFKKVITLPSRIDPHQTSAVVTLHGQLFVRAPFEHSEV